MSPEREAEARHDTAANCIWGFVGAAGVILAAAWALHLIGGL